MTEIIKSDIYLNFIEYLNSRIEAKDITLKELSKKADISASYLTHLLKGQVNIPSDKKLLQIAEALDITPKELILIESGRVPDNMPELIDVLRGIGLMGKKDRQGFIKGLGALNKLINKED